MLYFAPANNIFYLFQQVDPPGQPAERVCPATHRPTAASAAAANRKRKFPDPEAIHHVQVPVVRQRAAPHVGPAEDQLVPGI